MFNINESGIIMIIVLRNGKDLSAKGRFITQLFKFSLNAKVLCLYRKQDEMFREEWGSSKIELATSISAIIMNFILNVFKTPTNIHDDLIRRLMSRPPFIAEKRSSLFWILQVLGQYAAKSARTSRILQFLQKNKSPKIFLIDEFFSIRLFNLKKLKKLGHIIYVSSDLAYDYYGDNRITSNLMYQFERDALAMVDLVIACSERDQLKYFEMGADNVIYYPNIYPIEEFNMYSKEQTPSISIIFRSYWGYRSHRALEEVFNALSYIKQPIRVYLIGAKPKKIPKNIDLKHYTFVQDKTDFLKILSKTWIGINIGIHKGGSNQRKYDYAMAGLVVLSDSLGSRGDLLPNEYTYVDNYDLAAKINQLISLGKTTIIDMGLENRKQALRLAGVQKEKLLKIISNMAY